MRGADRGQLLLVGGILLAVMFVVLALLVNTAIYTDNVATRGGDAAGEALEYQAGVVDSVGGLMDAENAHGGHATVGEITLAVENGIGEIDAAMRQNHLRRGAATNVTVESASDETTDGLLIRERDVNEFKNWDANATAVRGFVVELDPDNMTVGEPLEIVLNDTRVEVNRTDDDDIVVEGGTANTECTVDAADVGEVVRFDVTGESLDGESCRFGWPDLDEDSQIAFENGTNAGGSYELTVAEESKDNVTGPEISDALYSIDALSIRIDSPEVSYETTIRIAPGEPDV